MKRHNWALPELQDLYDLPLIELISKAHQVHIENHRIGEIQVGHLISIKTGGCPEDCKYCAQSSRYQTPVSAQPLMAYEEVLIQAQKAIDQGATRICLGAAWREVRDSKQFEQVLEMIRGIACKGVEVCCTLGMVNKSQAQRLKEAGLYAYNHNLDTSEEFYKTIITTRTYQDRLRTLDTVDEVGLTSCCGAILGMGETVIDRLQFLVTVSNRNPHPASVPINRLTPIPGTPLENQLPISIWEMLRIVAIARLTMPKTMVRLSAGRVAMSKEDQLLCFFAGANSLFIGETLLTVDNPAFEQDQEMFNLLGLKCK